METIRQVCLASGYLALTQLLVANAIYRTQHCHRVQFWVFSHKSPGHLPTSRSSQCNCSKQCRHFTAAEHILTVCVLIHGEAISSNSLNIKYNLLFQLLNLLTFKCSGIVFLCLTSIEWCRSVFLNLLQ